MSAAHTGVILCCDGLSVGHNGQAVLEDLDLSFSQAQFISLLGPNGAGKTTLLRTLTRHLPALAGRVELLGRPLASYRQSDLARIMAVVLTDKITPPLFSAFEFVALGRYPHTDFLGRLSEADREAVKRALASVHAEELAAREFTTLSDGERQKILVARALAQEPQVLVLDEPTSHLDLKHRVEVMSILRGLCASHKLTVIASLHDVDIAAKVSDQVVLVKDGRLIACGAPEEMLDSQAVADLYDFTDASFNSQLGSLELHGSRSKGRVFVVGGMGCGAALYRLLAKCGYAVSSGVLYANDIDAYVAESLDICRIVQPPAAAVATASLKRAFAELPSCDCVVDAGCDLGGIYEENQHILKEAVKLGKPLFSFAEQKRHGGRQLAGVAELPAAIAAAMERG